MKEFVNRFAVAAPPERVWTVMEEIERWPGWTPTVTRVEPLQSGPAQVGAKYKLKQPGMPAAVWEVTAWEPGRGFVWVSRSLGMTSTAEHAVVAASGGSEVTLRVVFRGPLSGVVACLFGKMTERFVAQEAEGLKKRAESPQAR